MNLSTRFDFEARARLYVQSHPPFAWASTPRVLKNPLNGSGGTTVGARMAANARRKGDRQVGGLLARRLEGADPSHRWVVVLQRVSPRAFDDDGLAASLKSIRDGIAEAWDVDDDAESRVLFLVDQRRGEPKEQAVCAGLWVWRAEQSARAPGGAPSDVEVDPSDYERPKRALQQSDPRLSLWGAVTPKHLDVRFKPNVVKPGGGR